MKNQNILEYFLSKLKISKSSEILELFLTTAQFESIFVNNLKPKMSTQSFLQFTDFVNSKTDLFLNEKNLENDFKSFVINLKHYLQTYQIYPCFYSFNWEISADEIQNKLINQQINEFMALNCSKFCEEMKTNVYLNEDIIHFLNHFHEFSINYCLNFKDFETMGNWKEFNDKLGNEFIFLKKSDFNFLAGVISNELIKLATKSNYSLSKWIAIDLNNLAVEQVESLKINFRQKNI